LNFPATCVQAEGQPSVSRVDLLQSLLKAIQSRRALIASDTFHRDWESVLALRGETVRVWVSDAESLTGQVLGLEMDGSLQLRLPAGGVRVIRFGEVHLRPASL
jgi:biotin-(acetyl-CoA carboxylase) ligase